VEHFIEALLAEPNARIRLNELDYADNEEARSQRFQLLSRPTFIGGNVPADALGYSDGLVVWHKAAGKVAQRREPELHTIIVDDFVAAVCDGPVLEDDNLQKIQTVLAKYRMQPTVPFRSEVRARFNQVDREIADARYDVIAHIEDVGRKVDGVGGEVVRVGRQVAEVKADTEAILANTTALRDRLLPAEMRFSGLLLLMMILITTFGGACAGLLARWQWGGL
jgi:hypothetical protein